jgi:hypothetical protein
MSGRMQAKLEVLGETGLMLSDETIEKIKSALSELPEASTSIV